MKLLSLLTTAAAVTVLLSPAAHAQVRNTQSGAPSPLSGVYMGGFGGYGWTDADTNGAGGFDLEGGDYGLFAGYQLDGLLDRTLGMGINGALEFHYAWSDQDEKRVVAGVPVTLEKDHEWGVSFRPGLSFVDQIMPVGIKPYGILGYRQAEFEANGAGLTSDETFHGFELGLGTELIAFNDFGVRLDYSHVWYGEEGGIDPDEDNVRLGLAYHF